jgi:toxin-antitoxin system PIN domain toxin
MIIPDINLLIYATDDASRFHRKARGWWETTLSGRETVALPWAVTLGFIRLATHPRVFVTPLTIAAACAAAREWLARPMVQIIEPGHRHQDILFHLLEQAGTGANLTTDAHLAAIAIEYQAVLYTSDNDFGRFPGLRFRNPLG